MKKVLRHNIDIIKRGDDHRLVWSVKNLTDHPFIFHKGIALLDENRKYTHPRFIPLNFTEGNGIPPKSEGIILNDLLVTDKITNYRFWLANYGSLGLEEAASSTRFWINTSQYKKLIKKLDKLSAALGLNPEIEQGLYVQMKDTNEQIDKARSSNGTETIINIEYYEGHSPDKDFSEKNIEQSVIR